MKVETVAIIVNQKKENAVRSVEEFSKWLESKGIEVIVPMNESSGYGLRDAKNQEKETPQIITALDKADVVITFGGDGTVLKTARLLKNKETPLFTVNFGRVGFLAEVKPEYLKKSFEDLLNDRFNLIKRRLLKGTVKEADNEFFVLNDIIIANKDYRTLNLDVFIDGSFLYSYSCDGFVIASSTGSTAYSLSLGGPILTPDVGAKVLIPVNPHTLFNRSLVVSEHEDIEIVPRDGRIEILADGFLIDAPDTSSVIVGSSDKQINIIRFEESSFVEHLRERLFKL